MQAINEVEKASAALEEKLERFQDGPASYEVKREGELLVAGLLYRLDLVRYNPHFDADGEVSSSELFLLISPCYYYQENKPHVFRSEEMIEEDTFRFIFRNSDGYELTVEERDIPEFGEPEYREQWERWEKFYSEDEKFLAQLYELNLKGAKEIADSF